MIKTLRAFTLHLPSVSVGLVFSTMSMLLASWIARIPEIQERLRLSEGKLGLVLLGMSAGALLVTPVSGWLLKKLPTGQAVIISSLTTCAILPLVAFAPTSLALVAVLIALGLSNSFMNVAMNAAAAAIEQGYRVRIMSTCHGMFSLGGFVGAGSSGLIAWLGIPLSMHLIVVALLLIGLNLALRPVLLALPEGEKEGAAFALPSKGLLTLAIIGFCIMLGEGAIADWSAIYLKNSLQSGAFVAGLGYATFSLMMATGRFYGDIVRQKFKPKKVIYTGSLIGAAGLMLAVLVPYPVAAVTGFAVVGVGFSIIVPILFSEAATTEGFASGTGIAVVVTAGTVGLLVGPPFIGLIGEVTGIRMGLACVAVLALFSTLLAKKM
jgi:MFS family permease